MKPVPAYVQELLVALEREQAQQVAVAVAAEREACVQICRAALIKVNSEWGSTFRGDAADSAAQLHAKRETISLVHTVICEIKDAVEAAIRARGQS